MTHTILIVDDNDLNLDLLGKILEMEGYRIMKAINGNEAVEAIMREMPDLAILDVMMPDIDGYELCRKLRQPPLNVKIPIVMLTAMNPEMEKEHTLDAGANEIWSKPFEMDVFTRRLRELLIAS
jgi:DNA-binding response OmpR family regulator